MAKSFGFSEMFIIIVAQHNIIRICNVPIKSIFVYFKFRTYCSRQQRYRLPNEVTVEANAHEMLRLTQAFELQGIG